jgi:hypothetical protein
MSASNRLNLWMAADIAERDSLDSLNGLAVGDFCLVEATRNLYICTEAAGTLPSVWLPIAGLPTTGHYALSGKNITGAPATLFQRQAFTFRAVLDDDPTPMGIMLSPDTSSNWNVMADMVVSTDEFGFVVEGRSVAISANTEAFVDGLYTILF